MRVRGTRTLASVALVVEHSKQFRGSMRVHRNGLAAKTREFVVVGGLGPDCNLGVYNNDVGGVERALLERYYFCRSGGQFRPALPVFPQAYQTASLQAFRQQFSDNMSKVPLLTRSQVVETYQGRKRRVYQEAYRSLQEDPLGTHDSKLRSFVKFEKQDVGKAPRIINPRSPRFNLVLGTYLKRAEHKCFRAINKVFGRRTFATVIKGLNADDSAAVLRAKWGVFENPVAVGADAEKFDMHVSQEALKYEHSFYEDMFPGDCRLKWLLKQQLVNRGKAVVADGTVEFEIKGTRSSGDLNTSLGNCIIMCALMWAYAREKGIDVELANNGDDCVIFMEQRDLERFREGFSEWFKAKGFAMVTEEPVTEFEQIEFCQTRPVELSTGWRMVRNWKAVVEKDPMCLIPVPNTNVYRKWLDAVGTCGGVLAQGVPVLSAFYATMKRAGLPCGKLINEVYKNRSQLQLGVGVAAAEIDARSRVSFYYAFGITPDEQLQIENHYKSLTLVPEMAGIFHKDIVTLNPGFNVHTEKPE